MDSDFTVTVLIATVPEHFRFPGDLTVRELTMAVMSRTKRLAKALSFRFAGKLLDDPMKKLSFYGVRSGCKLNARIKLLPGLDCLGPFAVEPKLNVQYFLQGDAYAQIVGPRTVLQKFFNITGENEIFCQMSPKHHVTLPEALRKEAHIPLGENVYFSWVYPFVKTSRSTAEKIKTLDPSDPLIALMLYGGFLYVDQNDKVLQVNGVKGGPGLYFDGPYNMSQKCFEEIYKAGRFQEITIDLEGCKGFCWFLPSEEVSIKEKIGEDPFTDDQGNAVSILHGAFGYECDAHKHRIFRISDVIAQGFFPVAEFLSLAHRDCEVDDSQNCVLCLEPYTEENQQQRMVCKPCLHACLHHSCANQLLAASKRPQCPICRADVTHLERMPYT